MNMKIEQTIERTKQKIAKLRKEAEERKELSALRQTIKEREAHHEAVSRELSQEQRKLLELEKEKIQEANALQERAWREGAEKLAESQPTFEEAVRAAVISEESRRYEVVPYPTYAGEKREITFEPDAPADISYSVFREEYERAQKDQAYEWVKKNLLSEEKHQRQLEAVYNYLMKKNLIAFR